MSSLGKMNVEKNYEMLVCSHHTHWTISLGVCTLIESIGDH